MTTALPPPPLLSRSSSSFRGRHPRSRGERTLLKELSSRLDAALSIADANGPAVRALGATAASSAAASSRRLLAVASGEDAAFASNGGPSASLFYAPHPVAGVGNATRARHFADSGSSSSSSSSMLPPADELALRHYGVQQLSDYARSELLGVISEYLPAEGDYPVGGTPRSRFDSLLARMQQHQLARIVQNELNAKQPDEMWSFNENRFHLAPVTGSKRVIPVDAWASFIQTGGDPNNMGVGLEVRPDVAVN